MLKAKDVIRIETYDASIPGCTYNLPGMDAATYNKVCSMIDNPTEYSVEELAQALDETVLCLEGAENHIHALHSHLTTMKRVWSRWLPLVRPDKSKEV